ncbi:IS1595 family transposase [Thermospira aquatica]|uniref:Transposase n=1 Tax=Thermospira aquatica TaxID=2828656 RepID=A0AAX3BBP8_9SPIR|nr:IS1595 family transposase [Thermospira aquatica]URA09711.1 transposase [Thermospira aquatica]
MEKDFFTLSENGAYQILEKALWPEGAICPHCKAKAHLLSCRLVYQCTKCGRQFSLKSQSIMRKSHLSPKVWLIAIFLVSQDGGINAVKLSQLLHISYKASWLLLQKLRSLMRLTNRHYTTQNPYENLLKPFSFFPVSNAASGKISPRCRLSKLMRMIPLPNFTFTLWMM